MMDVNNSTIENRQRIWDAKSGELTDVSQHLRFHIGLF